MVSRLGGVQTLESALLLSQVPAGVRSQDATPPPGKGPHGRRGALPAQQRAAAAGRSLVGSQDGRRHRRHRSRGASLRPAASLLQQASLSTQGAGRLSSTGCLCGPCAHKLLLSAVL